MELVKNLRLKTAYCIKLVSRPENCKMYGKNLLVFSAIIVAFVVISAVEGQKGTPEIKCLGEKIDFSKKEAVLQECKEELKDKMPAEGEGSKAMKGYYRCLETCGFKKMGLLTSDDKFDMAVVNDYIDTTIPEKAREGIKNGIQKCADAMTGTLSDDDNCKNHSTYQTCIMKAYMKNCS